MDFTVGKRMLDCTFLELRMAKAYIVYSFQNPKFWPILHIYILEFALENDSGQWLVRRHPLTWMQSSWQEELRELCRVRASHHQQGPYGRPTLCMNLDRTNDLLKPF